MLVVPSVIMFWFTPTGLHAVRARLRVPHPGQRVPDAQAGHQDAEEGPSPAGVGVQDVHSHQESHIARAQGPVRREKRMRGVAADIRASVRDHRSVSIVFGQYDILLRRFVTAIRTLRLESDSCGIRMVFYCL